MFRKLLFLLLLSTFFSSAVPPYKELEKSNVSEYQVFLGKNCHNKKIDTPCDLSGLKNTLHHRLIFQILKDVVDATISFAIHRVDFIVKIFFTSQLLLNYDELYLTILSAKHHPPTLLP